MFFPTRPNRLTARKPDSAAGPQDPVRARVYVVAGDKSGRSMPAKRRERQRLIAARGTGA